MNRSKIVFLSIAILSHLGTYAMEQAVMLYNSMDEIENECFAFLQELDGRPIITDNSQQIEKRFKVLQVPADRTLSLCWAIEFLCNTAITQLRQKQAWNVESADSFTSPFFKQGEKGLIKELFDAYESIEYSYDRLQQQIKRIIKQVTTDWKPSKKSAYPDVYNTYYNQKHYSLLVKSGSIYERDFFVAVEKILKLRSGFVVCYPQACDNKYKNLIFLWISKYRFDEIIQKLGLKITA